MKKITHTGILRAYGWALPSEVKVLLRETKLFWVTDDGRKYRKGSGHPPGDEWPHYYLDVNTIRKNTESTHEI